MGLFGNKTAVQVVEEGHECNLSKIVERGYPLGTIAACPGCGKRFILEEERAEGWRSSRKVRMWNELDADGNGKTVTFTVPKEIWDELVAADNRRSDDNAYRIAVANAAYRLILHSYKAEPPIDEEEEDD